MAADVTKRRPPDWDQEPEIAGTVPRGLTIPERELWLRVYNGTLLLGSPEAQARQIASERVTQARRFIKAERDPKNKPKIPSQPKGEKPGQWRRS